MELPPPPPGLDIYEDRATHVIASVVAPAILAIIAVGLRIWARHLSQAGFKWDDYLIIIALVFSTGDCALNILMVKLGGMGKHIWNPNIDMVVMYKLIFAMEFVYSCAIPAIKMSVIMFYHRIFAVSNFKYVLYFCTFLVLGWFVAVMVVNIVQCQPYQYLWEQFDPNAKGKCIDVELYFLWNGICESVTDFIILGAPFHEVWKLHMPRAQKLALAGIFGLGIFTCVAGVLRCYAVKLMTENHDTTWNFGRGFIWSSIEPSLGIISACLPTLRPLVKHIFPSAFGSTKKTSQYGYKNSDIGHGSKSGEFYRLQDRGNSVPDTDQVALTNDIRKGAAGSAAESDPEHDPHYSITVQREILWTSKEAGK
ncbi:hypothetical protein FQN54_006370 [Arachnomyces sp. PD_36]|nr:hypothetical protein FQN54_006370 [Arachnomyces sp. PD_36]